MPKLKKSQFRFRNHERVGAEGAEEDQDYLRNCFFDTGDLNTLRDCSSANRIVLGRTGAGKTALLFKLSTLEEKTISLDPHALSLQYVSNSTVLRHLSNLGVNLDLFYKLLWRHVFAVELIKARYQIHTEPARRTWLEMILPSFLGDRSKQKAIEYLIQWGKSFWEDTEYRIHEVTRKLEDEVRLHIGTSASILDSSHDSHQRLAAEEKAELIHRAQEVVKGIQIRELNEIVKLLAQDFLNQQQPRYYIVIDRLDEHWVEDPVRYRLIRALIETVKEFSCIKSAKIIVALRRDLFDRIVRVTRDAGFQEEKYHPLFLPLRWSQQQLMGLLDQRINALVKRQYTGGHVSWRDLLPARIDGRDTDRWIVERTMYRPRDMIVFFNCCLSQAVGRPEISATMLHHAEAEYSRLRYRSLGDEWHADYPELLNFATLLKERPASFQIEHIRSEEIKEKCLEFATKDVSTGGELSEWAKCVAQGEMDAYDFRARLFQVLYKVGLVGVKTERFTTVTWSYVQEAPLSVEEIEKATAIAVSPVFYRILGIQAE